MAALRQPQVLGRGAVSCFGEGTATLLDATFAGRSGVAPLRRVAAVDEIARLGAELPQALADAAAAKGWSLPRHIAALAAGEALAEAGVDPRVCGLVLATTKADLSGIEGDGRGLGSPMRLADQLAADLGLGGPSLAVSCACASGLSALALAARWLAESRCPDVLVVGVDTISDFVLRGFRALLALDPEPCRPFDKTRAGLTLGEGAGALVVGAAAGRHGGLGVRLRGSGESNDAFGVTAPPPQGDGLLAAARAALDRAGVAADAVDYVHLHGTGTLYNDAMECAAMQRLFAGVDAPPMSGSKAQLGHTLGAAGVLESIVAIEALRRGEAPANVRLREPDASSSLPLPQRPTKLRAARAALKLAAGFGGINVALVFGT